MKNTLTKICIILVSSMFVWGCGGSDHSNKAPNDNTGNPSDNTGNPNDNTGNPNDNTGNPNDNTGNPTDTGVTNRTVSGVSQKGPFITGSSVTVQELDGGETLRQTGNSFKGKISNNRGEFSVTSISLVSQYALLEVSGYYRNEVTGKNSTSLIVMNALVDISDRENVNINLLTHLETDRVMRLVTVDHVEFNQAKRQAREELMGDFGFTGDFGEAEDMNIFGDNNDAAALLAMSVIAQGNLNESSFTERITHISSDIADGTVDNDNLWREMAIWAMSADLSAIRQNMENWGEHVPEFEKYIRQFWRSTLDLTSCSNIDGFSEVEGTILICRADGWDRANPDEILNYYLGKCDSSNQDEVKRCEGESEYCAGKMMVCHDTVWSDASQDDIINSIGIKNFGQCREDKQGEIASCKGKEVCCPSEEFCFDGITLICRDGRWRTAQYEEILSYYLGTCDSGNEGEIKQCEAEY
ncbi:MAG: hypothetical protein J6A01_06965, partial [Proteobacteria bacterium]|nr:hypothetical protein [Pseudomonadota bacterium]